jgi:hypothetical protein
MFVSVLLAAMVQTIAPATPQSAPALSRIAPAPVVAAATTVAKPATTTPEVAAVVAKEFPAYDKDRSGTLSAAEFAEWMVRLKAIADPSVTADAPSTRTWLGAAFAQADADKSRSVTEAELNGFLAQGRS